MPDLEHRLEQDRAMRDAARRLVEADLSMVRQDDGLARRAADEVKDTSATFAGRAGDFAREHPVAIGAGIAALVLLLLRGVLLDLIIGFLEADDEGDQPRRPDERTRPSAEPAHPADRSVRE